MTYRRNPRKRFPTKPIQSGCDVYEIAKDLGAYPREHLVVLLLDARCLLVGYETVSIGTAQASLVSTACVFQAALLVNARSIILVHTHPSGVAEPSEEDRKVTMRLKLAGELIGIEVVDHVIVGETGYYSFADAGELKP